MENVGNRKEVEDNDSLQADWLPDKKEMAHMTCLHSPFQTFLL